MLSQHSTAMLALACSAIGLVLLLAVSALEKPLFLKISELENYPPTKIAVRARIVSEYYSKNTLFLTLYDGNFLKALMFNPSLQVLEIAEKGNRVTAVGSLQKNRKESVLFISELRKIA
ncbi:hypothetical protein HZB88_05170 [archaeon]|nr:hypothetical protein [archaeon]